LNKNLQITISDNRLEAYISIQDISAVTGDVIHQALAAANINTGIDQQTIVELLADKQSVAKKVIARGKTADPGEDARLIWNIDLANSSRPKISDTGQADFKNLSLYKEVSKDQALVYKLPATSGNAGTTVTGEIYYLQGRDVSLPDGVNTLLSEDRLTLFADRAGQAFWEAGKLKIDTVFRVDGDVDFSTGNIQFNGSVFIGGDVRSGFRVEATGSIVIGGTVEAATVYSENGDITISAGVLGRGKCTIFTGKNLRCLFLQDATVGTEGDLQVDRYIINCMISAKGKIELSKAASLIRGGKVNSTKSIFTGSIGTDKNISTEVIVGSRHQQEESSVEWGLQEERKHLNAKLTNAKQRVKFIKLLKERLPTLSADRQKELDQITLEVDLLQEQLDHLDSRKTGLQSKWNQIDQDRTITVTGQLHRNVNVEIGGITIKTDRPYHDVVLSRHENEIRIKSILTPQPQK